MRESGRVVAATSWMARRSLVICRYSRIEVPNAARNFRAR
jgi:hypothetical protein